MDKETPITPTAQGSPPRYGDVLPSQVSGFNELIGQSDCTERLKRFGELYSSKNGVPEHVLLTGNEGTGKRVFIDRILAAGATYRVPNMAGLRLIARDAGAVEVILDGISVGFAGKNGVTASGLSLTPQNVITLRQPG